MLRLQLLAHVVSRGGSSLWYTTPEHHAGHSSVLPCWPRDCAGHTLHTPTCVQ